ncbi:metal ABC transporter ATP-binding protein [Actinotignum urinale]|uniref:metal ABC transporter ATP-binding protein n=1 Tax=Actinotignum urinale TaxID=190146 RepID=UPI0003B4D695|nr:ATP-binding cassette domain-containing protein [Actinotignum urinale]MDY5160820.1 ATP-binding cassette domain-containing protein [Actinotignum urinale]
MITPLSSSPHQSVGQVSALEADNLCVTLSGIEIIHSANLCISSGESVGIFGPNGSGKSTLIKGLLGVVPHTGTAKIFGQDITVRSAVEWNRVGYVPQNMTHTGTLPASALEVVKSGLISGKHLFKDRGRKARAKAMEALDAVGLAHRANDTVRVFSGGQQHRVLIARALVRKPDILVLDEPLAGIDRESREELATILTRLHGEGITLAMVLHEVGELGHLVQRRITVEAGRVYS